MIEYRFLGLKPSFALQANFSSKLAIFLLLAASLIAWSGDDVRAKDTGGDASIPAIYSAQCAACHGAKREGGFSPALLGESFARRWRGKTGELSDYIARTMPPASPNLNPATARGLALYLLSGKYQGVADSHGSWNSEAIVVPPERVLSADAALVGSGVMPDDYYDETARSLAAARDELINMMTPVDADTLANPPAADWPMWRRSYTAQGFSPLTQVNPDTVGRLGLSWARALAPGTNAIEPLVRDGIIFINSSHVINALDGSNGDLIWEHRYTAKARGVPVSQPRNMALWGDTLIVPTGDAHLIALDARTGALRWKHVIAEADDGFQLTSGPIIVDGIILQGVAGCSSFLKDHCFAVAVDIVTGEELWRFETVADAGEFGGDTWNDAPDEARYGGSIWTAPSYSPKFNLVYFGTGQTYHVGPLLEPKSETSRANSGLFTNSTLAIRPNTGKLIWHYQHFARDVWDFDWGFERTLIDAVIAGQPRTLLVTIGKLGIIDVLDAQTGAYLDSHDLGFQTLVEKIDEMGGSKQIFDRFAPSPGNTSTVCPGSFGVRNWPATAFDPQHSTLYVPAIDHCGEFTYDPQVKRDMGFKVIPNANAGGKFGQVIATAIPSGEERWVKKSRAPTSSAALATGGGLLFTGARDRYFKALDSQSGATLWQTRLGSAPSAFPISYAIKDKQYIAIVAGGGSPFDASMRPLTAEIADPPLSNTLYVFALPEPEAE